MTQQGFEDYLFAIFDQKTGAAKSYITAIHIIDEMFTYNDAFELKGKSLTCINDLQLLLQIEQFIIEQQTHFKKGNSSIFDHINEKQRSYPDRYFCSAAMKQLIKYHNYDLEELEAGKIVTPSKKGTKVSQELISFFEIDKVGSDVQVTTSARLGQSYFRKMVLANYGNKCCVTGLNVPQILRASHIVAWAESKQHRMDPENGLCLSATYDAAFDKHLISFDDDYRMIVSKEIQDYYTNEAAREYFEKFEGKKILLPKTFLPSKKLLERHRNFMA